MILPSKHLSQDRALLTIGATILANISHPITVSALWEQLARAASVAESASTIRYDGFVLALDLLFIIGAIDLHDGTLSRRTA
jgi:hypothetical protein